MISLYIQYFFNNFVIHILTDNYQLVGILLNNNSFFFIMYLPTQPGLYQQIIFITINFLTDINTNQNISSHYFQKVQKVILYIQVTQIQCGIQFKCNLQQYRIQLGLKESIMTHIFIINFYEYVILFIVHQVKLFNK
ncbi:hypothetical protein SS50377_20152 [Spironucleus salmonicida]|uniref:Transmembrane protein n=1 Tax=Spironucleus salmonicida TaxID=348837 RepID=A0A9P8LYW2_9EUKA|nr:hypothetical protein SS50377_20152 [Spironucleus salmonicida]